MALIKLFDKETGSYINHYHADVVPVIGDKVAIVDDFYLVETVHHNVTKDVISGDVDSYIFTHVELQVTSVFF